MTEDTMAEGEFEKLEVRSMWKDEARDFTPWLARNLHLLGRELDMKLELVQTEAQVGSFSLDILAREVDTGKIVAIENQLEWTDFSHLGQLLTYATGRGAHIAIWIAPELRYEHTEALHRLNEWTSNGIRFYGVKVDVVKRVGDSQPQARFYKVVHPDGWDRDATLKPFPPPPLDIREDRRKHRDFFRPLVDELMRRDFADSVVQYYSHTGRLFRSRVGQGIGYVACFDKGIAWVTLDFRTDDIERTNRIYDEFLAQRDDIEASIDVGPNPEWVWQRYDKQYFSCINVKRDGIIDNPPETLAETRVWMLDMLVKFRETFDPRAAEIFARLS